MKRFLALILAIVMLASVGCAAAEGTILDLLSLVGIPVAEDIPVPEYPDEITFQDIPWGSSMEEVESWAKENGFQSEVNTRPMKIAHLNESGGYWCSKANYVFEGAELLIADGNASFRIAGYAIDRLTFYFVVHDGKTELGTVEVLPVQPTKETEAVMKDLEQKLITVYGGRAFSGIMIGSGPIYRKVGAENTAVCLTYQLSEGGVMLVYGKINAFAPEEANVAPLIIDSSNIDGL